MNVFFDANYVESDAVKIRYAISLLRGAAMDWWRVIVTSPRAYEPPSQEEGPMGPAVTWSSFCETAEYSTWDAWCAGLRARFEPIAASISARQRLRTWRQLWSVHDYTNGFLTLCEQVGYMHEAERVDRYVGGLKPDISHEIMLRELSNFNEILALAEKIDILRRLRPGSYYGHRHRGPTSTPLYTPLWRMQLLRHLRLVVLGVYGCTDPLLNKPFYPNAQQAQSQAPGTPGQPAPQASQHGSVGQPASAASDGVVCHDGDDDHGTTHPEATNVARSQPRVMISAPTNDSALPSPMSLKPQHPPCFDPSQRGGPTVQDTAKIRYAVSLLRGPAMDWWRVIVTMPMDYATLPIKEGQTRP
ncbi:unnamed protein product [Closterium sp. NIES-54]